MPSFLAEPLPVGRYDRMKHRIKINLRQVDQIPGIPAGNGKHRHIRKCHCVQECVHAALQQFHKGFANRIVAAPAQYAVLQNVKDAGGIMRKRTERNGKHHIFSAVVKPAQICSRPNVNHPEQASLQLAFLLHRNNPESVNDLSRPVYIHHSKLLPCRIFFSILLDSAILSRMIPAGFFRRMLY